MYIQWGMQFPFDFSHMIIFAMHMIVHFKEVI